MQNRNYPEISSGKSFKIPAEAEAQIGNQASKQFMTNQKKIIIINKSHPFLSQAAFPGQPQTQAAPARGLGNVERTSTDFKTHGEGKGSPLFVASIACEALQAETSLKPARHTSALNPLERA